MRQSFTHLNCKRQIAIVGKNKLSVCNALRWCISLLIIISGTTNFNAIAQYTTQGICSQTGNIFNLSSVSQEPYVGRFWKNTKIDLTNDFEINFNVALGSSYNYGLAFVMQRTAQPTSTDPATNIYNDYIWNFGTGSIPNIFAIGIAMEYHFCAVGQNQSYFPASGIPRIDMLKSGDVCNVANYFGSYGTLSAGGTIDYYNFQPYKIKYTKSSNTVAAYFNNVLIKSAVIDLAALLGGNDAWWGFSSGCYCVPGYPQVQIADAPAVSSFTPDNGYSGTSVTILGTNFTGSTAVTIGGTNVASFTVNDDSHITAIVGAGITGTVGVTTPGGTATSVNNFIYSGYVTASDGDWNAGSTWVGGNVPPVGADKTVNHAVNIHSPVTNSGSITANTYFNIYSTFTNNGSTTIAGSLQMGDGGVFVNNGTISYGPYGTLGYYNSAARTTGDEFPAVNGPQRLVASNLGGVTLHASRTVDYLQINAAKLTLGDNNITVGAISYSTPAHYIVTNGVGTLTIKNISSSPVLFPIGPSATSYNPMTISNGGGDDFSVKVQPSFTIALNDASKAVNAQWMISKTGAQTGNNVTLTPQWNASDEVGYPSPTFDRNGSIVLGHYGGSTWNEISASPVSGADPYTTAVTGVSSFSPFGVGNAGAFAVAAYVTATDGAWSAGSTWVGGNVPPVGASVIINHIVTMDVSPIINSGDSMIVNGALITGYNIVSGAGSITINGLVKTINGAGFSGASNASFSNTLSSVTLNSSSTVEYAGFGNTIITPINYANLNSSGVGGRILPQGSIGISGIFTPGTNTWTTLDAYSTVEFNGTDPQEIPAIPYDNLSLSNTGIKTLGNTAGSTVVGGNITIGPGSTLNAFGSLYIKGNWINDGSYWNNNSFVIFNGVNSQTITGTYPTTFRELLVSNEAGIYLNKDLRIASGGRLVFGMDNTKLHTGTNRVILEAGAINNIDNNPTTYIHGSLQMTLSSSDSYTTKYFKIGDANTYCPVTIDVLDVAYSQDIVVSPSEPGDHPNISASALNANKSVNRYWKLTSDYALTFAGTYDVTFEFSPADVDGGANPANFKIGMYSDGAWTYPNTVYIDATHIKATGISGFGDFAIAEGACTEPPPPPSADGAAICKYSNASLFASGIGTIGWYDAPSGGNWLGGGTNFITGTVSGNTIYYVQDSTCQASATRTPVIVTVSAPVVTASASNTIVCQGTPVTLYGGGATSYSWSNGGGAFGIYDGIPFTPLYTDTYFVSGSDETGCYGAASITVVVNPSVTYYQDADGDGFGNPSVSIQSCTQPQGYVTNNTDCDDTKLLYADNDGDGYGAGAPVACGVANNADCDDNDPNVYPYLPSLNITSDVNPLMVCEGLLVTFTATPFYGGNAPSYQWKKNNINVGTHSNTYSDASLADADVITCELTSNAACAINTTALSNSIFMHVHPLPVVNAGTYQAYTTNDPPFTLSGIPVGGSFSGPGVTGAGNMFDPSIAGPGNHSIIYFYADGNGCSNSATTIIHVTNYSGCTAAPALGSITGSTTACGIAGTPTTASYTIDNIPGATYSWTKSSSLIQIVSGQNTNSITATFSSNFSSGTITVTVTNACGSTARVISISKKTPATPGTISGITNPCAYVGTPVTYSIKKVAGATSYTWTVPAGSGIVGKTSPYTSPDTSIDVIYLSSFTSNTISVTAANACGTSAVRTLTVTNKVPATPGVINGPADVCDFIGANANVTYTINKVANATSYQWQIPAGVNIISTNINDTSIVVNFPGTYTTGTIQVKAKSGCGDGAFRSLTVAKRLPGTPGVITPTGDICSSIYTGTNTVTYTIPANTSTPLPTSYVWTLVPTVSQSAAIVSGTGVVGTPTGLVMETTGPGIHIQFYGNYTGGTLSVAAKKSCGTSAARKLTLTKNVPPTPAVPVASGNICSGVASSVTYTVSANSNSDYYIWSSPAGTKINGSQTKSPTKDTTTTNSIVVNYAANFTSGNITVKAKSICGTDSPATLSVISQPCSMLSNSVKSKVEISQQQTTAIIYPDPNDGDFMLKIKSANKTQSAQIEITNIMGQPVGKYTVSNDNGNILLHVNNKSITGGTYILKYKIGDDVKFLKFIIQK